MFFVKAFNLELVQSFLLKEEVINTIVILILWTGLKYIFPFLFGCQYTCCQSVFAFIEITVFFFFGLSSGQPYLVFGFFWNNCLLQFCEIRGGAKKYFLVA